MNLYKTLMKHDEFLQLTPHEQKMTMENWRKVHTNNEIMAAMGISKQTYYDLINDIGIEKKIRKKKQLKPVPVEGIMTFEEFEELSKEDKKEELTRLRNTYSTEDIKKAWGMPTYNFYKLLQELGIKKRKHKNTQAKEEKAIAIDSQPKEKEPKIERIKEEEPAQENHEQADEEPTLFDQKEVEKSFKENESDIKQLMKEMHEFFNRRQKADEIIEKALEQPKQVEPQVESTPINSTNGFTVNYEDQKEGFLHFHEIKQFISMLEKNPTTYKVKISMEKVD